MIAWCRWLCEENDSQEWIYSDFILILYFYDLFLPNSTYLSPLFNIVSCKVWLILTNISPWWSQFKTDWLIHSFIQSPTKTHLWWRGLNMMKLWWRWLWWKWLLPRCWSRGWGSVARILRTVRNNLRGWRAASWASAPGHTTPFFSRSLARAGTHTHIHKEREKGEVSLSLPPIRTKNHKINHFNHVKQSISCEQPWITWLKLSFTHLLVPAGRANLLAPPADWWLPSLLRKPGAALQAKDPHRHALKSGVGRYLRSWTETSSRVRTRPSRETRCALCALRHSRLSCAFLFMCGVAAAHQSRFQPRTNGRGR